MLYAVLLVAFAATIAFLVFSERGGEGNKVPVSGSYGVIPSAPSLRSSSHLPSSNDIIKTSTSSIDNNSNNNNDAGLCLCEIEHKRAKDAIDASISKISSDWDIKNYPEFLAFTHVPVDSWEIHKQKFIKVILEANANRRRSLSLNSSTSFVVGFSGSSVTAGHDNYFHQAYPQKFFEALQPVFSSLSITLTVRNQALGNNPCYPYDACAGTHLGEDVDVIAWEQSMNCGRDPKPIEHLMRDSMMMKKRPTVWFILSGTPYWTPNECENSNATSSTPKTKTLREEELLKNTAKFAINNASHLDNMGFLVVKKQNSAESLHMVYASVGAIGQNVMALQYYKCHGPYGANFCSRDVGLPVGSTWHPGMLGHKLKADSLAFVMLHILKEAIDILHPCDSASPTCSISSTSTSNSSSNRVRFTGGDLKLEHNNQAVYANTIQFLNKNQFNVKVPEQSIACDAMFCRTDRTAKCFTQFEPRIYASKHGIDDILIGARPTTILRNFSSVYDHLSKMNKSNISHNINTPLVHDSSVNNKWTKEISFYDIVAKEKLAYLNLGYLDNKVIYISHGLDAVLSFRVTVETDNTKLWLCELHPGFKKYPSIIGHLNTAADVSIDRNVSSSEKVDANHYEAYKARSSSPLTLAPAGDDCFQTNEIIGRGTHVVSIKQKHSSQMITLTYVLHW